MSKSNPKILVVATSRKTRGGITAVVKAHQTGEQWQDYHCRWVQTHRDGKRGVKIYYFITAFMTYIALLPFYDIVHIHAGLRKSIERKLIFAKIAKAMGKKIIVHFHPATERHLFEKEHSEKIHRLFSFSDRLIVLSYQWISWIDEAFPDNKFRYEVLYNPCPSVKRNTTFKTNTILYAGTLIDRKGYDRLIMAFAAIAKDYPQWRLVFAGNGEIEKATALVQQHDISSQVDFLGWISGEEKEAAFQTAAIYCLPSWGEGFPMGVLDAIAYGVPVVTTPVGGIPELIKDGVNGFVFEPYDVAALSEKLSVLIKDALQRSLLVSNADILAADVLNVVAINKKLAGIYQQLSFNQLT